MKYGESTFDILYLVLVILWGCQILKKARNRTERLMGASALILGFGDAFHLVPRVLNYFVAADFTAALGIGKLVTSITMTLFYVALAYVMDRYMPGRMPQAVSALAQRSMRAVKSLYDTSLP